MLSVKDYENCSTFAEIIVKIKLVWDTVYFRNAGSQTQPRSLFWLSRCMVRFPFETIVNRDLICLTVTLPINKYTFIGMKQMTKQTMTDIMVFITLILACDRFDNLFWPLTSPRPFDRPAFSATLLTSLSVSLFGEVTAATAVPSLVPATGSLAVTVILRWPTATFAWRRTTTKIFQ